MYEVWYNWEYARQHNPSLMGFGYTGGYGAVRKRMREAVARGDRNVAEANFWVLIEQTRKEVMDTAREDGLDDPEAFWEISLGYWMDEAIAIDNQAERNFVRETKEEKKVPWYKSVWENIAFWSALWFVMIAIMSNGGLT